MLKFRKVLSLLLSFSLIFAALVIPVHADEIEPGQGQIGVYLYDKYQNDNYGKKEPVLFYNGYLGQDEQVLPLESGSCLLPALGVGYHTLTFSCDTNTNDKYKSVQVELTVNEDGSMSAVNAQVSGNKIYVYMEPNEVVIQGVDSDTGMNINSEIGYEVYSNTSSGTNCQLMALGSFIITTINDFINTLNRVLFSDESDGVYKITGYGAAGENSAQVITSGPDGKLTFYYGFSNEYFVKPVNYPEGYVHRLFDNYGSQGDSLDFNIDTSGSNIFNLSFEPVYALFSTKDTFSNKSFDGVTLVVREKSGSRTWDIQMRKGFHSYMAVGNEVDSYTPESEDSDYNEYVLDRLPVGDYVLEAVGPAGYATENIDFSIEPDGSMALGETVVDRVEMNYSPTSSLIQFKWGKTGDPDKEGTSAGNVTFIVEKVHIDPSSGDYIVDKNMKFDLSSGIYFVSDTGEESLISSEEGTARLMALPEGTYRIKDTDWGSAGIRSKNKIFTVTNENVNENDAGCILEGNKYINYAIKYYKDGSLIQTVQQEGIADSIINKVNTDDLLPENYKVARTEGLPLTLQNEGGVISVYYEPVEVITQPPVTTPEDSGTPAPSPSETASPESSETAEPLPTDNNDVPDTADPVSSMSFILMALAGTTAALSRKIKNK